MRLLQHTARLTLFTRENCSLCTTAKNAITNVSKARSFDYHEIDVMAPDQERWKVYEYDTPVVSHIMFYQTSLVLIYVLVAPYPTSLSHLFKA